MTDAVRYWLKGDAVQNLGDYLSELFLARIRGPGPDPYPRIYLIGSVLSDYLIRRDLRASGIAAYWGCGQRDEKPIAQKLRDRCRFHGVRGPLTRSRLELPETTPIGDPALLLPILYQPRPRPELAQQTLCVPHYFERSPDEAIAQRTGANRVERPNIAATMEALLAMIDTIAAAGFVLAGALHAAIIACAYGRPFAFYIADYIDIPFKWLDFAASIDIPAVFARDVSEGQRAWSALLSPTLRRPPLSPILEVFPGPIQAGLRERAQEWDRAR